MRQAVNALYFGYVTRWKRLGHWLLRGQKTLPTAAGAIGMGCIGFPIHPVWEVTSTCNLKCVQCHADAGRKSLGELSTEEGKKLLDELAEIPEFRMLAFGGGEPLARPDIVELTGYARSLGLEVSIATNGTLLTRDLAREFKRMGVANIAVGLNSSDKRVHENITLVPGSFDRTMQAIDLVREHGMNLQINTTVMKESYSKVPELLDFASQVQAEIVLLYLLGCEGRGNTDMELSLQERENLARVVANKQRRSRALIEPVCFPQYFAYLIINGDSLMRLGKMCFKGCVAGSGLCYVKPDGEVWPCPFIPISGGNVRQAPLRHIWYNSDLFQSLRARENLKGECGSCSYKNVCGGCRGRAYAYSGDYLAEDPLCFLRKKEGQ